MMKRETRSSQNSHTWASRKSKYVTCEQCGSKLNVECLRLKRTCACPLCRNDLRSETVLNRIKAYDEKIKELRGKYAKEMKNAQEQGRCEVACEDGSPLLSVPAG